MVDLPSVGQLDTSPSVPDMLISPSRRFVRGAQKRKFLPRYQQRRRQACCAQVCSPVASPRSYREHQLLVYLPVDLRAELHTHIPLLGLHPAATYCLRSAPPEMLEWSPPLRPIFGISLQQAEGDIDDAGNMVRPRGNATTFVAIWEVDR